MTVNGENTGVWKQTTKTCTVVTLITNVNINTTHYRVIQNTCTKRHEVRIHKKLKWLLLANILGKNKLQHMKNTI